MIEKTCCFTGHRYIPANQYKYIVNQLNEIVTMLINKGYRYFGTGGALGFDTIAAQTVLNLKKQYSWIRLILVLPCVNQIKGWNKKEIDVYNKIKNRCDKYVYVSENYYEGCMQKRNRHLVNNSSCCVCYFTGKKGGTSYTVNYAAKKGLKIYNIGNNV